MLWWTLGYTCLFQIWFPWCVCPGVGLLGHMALLFPVFLRISTLFSIVAVLVCIPTNSVRGFPFLHTLSRLLDSVGEGEGGMFRENRIETSILSRVKQITSPGWMHEMGSQDWCTGMTQRDGIEREAGGGIGIGNTCKSMADSCQCMAKNTTIL